MRKSSSLLIAVLMASTARAQSPAAPARLSVHWEELTAADFREAISRARGACLLPFGIMEKHGPHLPARELRELETKTWINAIVQAIRAVEADSESLRLQTEFYERSKHPLDTPR